MTRVNIDDLIEGLDDFEGEDLDVDEAQSAEEAEERGRNRYIGDLWERYGYKYSSTADKTEALVTAHKMVQRFVDTFAGDRKYHVMFDPTISTAGTDIEGLKIAITPSPVFDKELTPQEAGLILTGMAAHESSHPRYGRSTAAAVTRVFGRKRAPNVLSNILDDVRIERRFAQDYPGYADVFKPMLEYVAKKAGPQMVPSLDDMVNFAGFAIRYSSYVSWGDDPDVLAERDWWQSWAARWAREDAPRRHVEAIREALRRIAQVRERRRLERERNAVKQQKNPLDFKIPETEEQKALKRAFAALSPLQKRAMKMASQGRSGREIAAALSVSVDDAKIVLRTARAAIADARRSGRLTTVARAASDIFEGVRKVDGLS